VTTKSEYREKDLGLEPLSCTKIVLSLILCMTAGRAYELYKEAAEVSGQDKDMMIGVGLCEYRLGDVHKVKDR